MNQQAKNQRQLNPGADRNNGDGKKENNKYPVLNSLRRFLTTPEAELTRWQYALRYLFVVCRHGVRQLREDRATQLAAALAFRTLFGLVPIIAIGMVLFQAFGGDAVFEKLISDIARASNLSEIKMPEGEATLVEFFQDLVKNTISKIEFKSIGVIGVLLLGWAAIGLLSTIEKSFNIVCRAPSSRPLRIRVPLFWLSITIGPVLIYYSFSIQSRFSTWVASVQSGAFFVWLLGLVTSFCTTWLLLLMLYRYMPNIRMNLRAAAVGSFVAALLWTVATRLLTGYLSNAFSGGSASYTVLYSSLGLIPIFMLWVYFIWIVVLFGLEVTSTLQSVGGSLLDPGAMPAINRYNPTICDYTQVLPVMQFIAERFKAGQPASATFISEQTELDPAIISAMLTTLKEDGFIHAVTSDEEDADDPDAEMPLPTWTLARPADQINAADLLKSALRAVDPASAATENSTGETPSAPPVLQRLRSAQLTSAAEIHLSDLLDKDD